MTLGERIELLGKRSLILVIRDKIGQQVSDLVHQKLTLSIDENQLAPVRPKKAGFYLFGIGKSALN